MKILLGTPFFAPYDSGKLLLKALGESGHSCVVWDYRVTPNPPKGNFNLTIINKGPVDPKKLTSPKVVFFPDDWHYYPAFLPLIKQYDQVYTLLKPDRPWMRWLPGFCDKSIHRKLGLEKKFDVGYIGTCRNVGIKAKFVVELINNLPKNISFCIFGNDWEKVGINAYRPQYFQNYNIICNYARMLLVVHPHDHGVTRKAFEFPATGTPTLIDRVDGVDEIFSDDEVIKYEHGNVEDCLEKIQYYLENEPELERVGRVGEKKAYQFTYKSQFERVSTRFDGNNYDRRHLSSSP